MTTDPAPADCLQEIGKIVHTVNNSIQSVLIRCTELKRTLGAQLPEQAASGLNGIARELAVLAAAVSDAKLERELQCLEFRGMSETVSWTDLSEELDALAEHLQEAKAIAFKWTCTAKLDPILTLSRLYLVTVLRSIVRAFAERRCQEINLSVSSGERRIKMTFSGKDLPEICETLAFPAASAFAAASGGRLQKTPGGLILELPAAAALQGGLLPEGQWILFVDDSAQMVRFYSQAAGALNLAHHAAESLQEAFSVIESKGRPRLLVTDLQLRDGSGLDLMTELERRFAGQVPVIVVSAFLDSLEHKEIDSRAKLLAKPISRRVLFEEIRKRL